jgi:hypothetical protein
MNLIDNNIGPLFQPLLEDVFLVRVIMATAACDEQRANWLSRGQAGY